MSTVQSKHRAWGTPRGAEWLCHARRALVGGILWEQPLLRSRAKAEFLFWGCLCFLFGATASKGN